VSYQLDDSDAVMVESLSFSSDPEEDFETYQVRAKQVDVSDHQQLLLTIRARVNGDDKALYWDRVEVSKP
jgi:hypothetical protein